MKPRDWKIATSTAIVLLLALGGGLLWLPEPTVDAAPSLQRNTDAFLGRQADWPDIAMVVQQVSPLYGAQEFYISGNGEIFIVAVKRDFSMSAIEQRFEITDAAAVTRLLTMLQHDALLSQTVEQELVPPAIGTGETRLLVRNHRGEVRQIPPLTYAPTPEYERFLHDVLALRPSPRRAAPIRQGAYEPGYIPDGFEWAAETIAPAKQIRWTRMPDKRQLIRAEREYQRKVRIQERAIEQNRADEMRLRRPERP